MVPAATAKRQRLVLGDGDVPPVDVPLEVGLADLVEVRCPAESVARLRNGNPAPVIASGVDYGEEVWASHDGKAIAIGSYRGGELHPTRVFVV